MRYVHWLKINRYCNCEEIAKQFFEINNYLESHPIAKAKLYHYDSGSCNLIVRLECNQCYNELDLDVNSFSTKLQRLTSKPKNIGREKNFEFPERYKIYLFSYESSYKNYKSGQ